MSPNIQTHYLSTKFSILCKWMCHVVCSSCPYFKVGVARTVPNSHVTVFCFIPLVFQNSRVLRTVNGAAYKTRFTHVTRVINIVTSLDSCQTNLSLGTILNRGKLDMCHSDIGMPPF